MSEEKEHDLEVFLPHNVNKVTADVMNNIVHVVARELVSEKGRETIPTGIYRTRVMTTWEDGKTYAGIKGKHSGFLVRIFFDKRPERRKK